MDYIEQLNTEEWKVKRSQILKRDSNKCTNCENLKYLELGQPGVALYSMFNGSYTSISIEHLDTSKNRLVTVYGKITSNVKGKYITCREIKGEVRLTGIIDLSTQLTLKSINIIDICNGLEPFVFYDTKMSSEELYNMGRSLKWDYCSHLHIHHKYYQKGKRAWQYPNDALLTLCWDCHENLHKNTSINVLDEDGNRIEERKLCTRCHGAGWFPAFTHIINGACFRCLGSRFEENTV